MDKMIYFLAGLAIGHILSRREETPSESAFMPMSLETLQQMQQMMQGPQFVPAPFAEQAANLQQDCTFRCWLCSGTTTFQYTQQPGPQEFAVDCQRCGMQNIIKLD